ncbi:hypothetical protein GOBAR_AA22612 [Gossypium barbadense]|uniref:Uncharacterized protein n=1 Tax=Gossypium barbadense TaxID=3634 RepID=A0A2P5X3X8_GOSBA|nr:hypothetical protein GOBAR_AA22612 [Gossypium barbadense]
MEVAVAMEKSRYCVSTEWVVINWRENKEFVMYSKQACIVGASLIGIVRVAFFDCTLGGTGLGSYIGSKRSRSSVYSRCAATLSFFSSIAL